VCAGTYANLVKQAKSKQKILDKMYEAGLTQPVQKERTFEFQFPGALMQTATALESGCPASLNAVLLTHYVLRCL
jgi:hypothetical protein